jgi:hypothetical protein
MKLRWCGTGRSPLCLKREGIASAIRLSAPSQVFLARRQRGEHGDHGGSVPLPTGPPVRVAHSLRDHRALRSASVLKDLAIFPAMRSSSTKQPPRQIRERHRRTVARMVCPAQRVAEWSTRNELATDPRRQAGNHPPGTKAGSTTPDPTLGNTTRNGASIANDGVSGATNMRPYISGPSARMTAANT